jgi:hypothetical protein
VKPPVACDPPPDRLREAGIIADALLHIESARQYGFVRGGPQCNVERCEIIIEMARDAGHTWTQEDVSEAAQAFMKEIHDAATAARADQ